MSERNFSPLLNDEIVSPLEPTSPDYAELQFHFNTLFNDTSKKLNTNETTMYEIEKAYSLKNQYISLNFEKREKNEVSAYGWYSSEVTDDKKVDELVSRLKSKGLEKIEHEIMVSALPSNDDNIHNIILCKFIVGESEVIFSDEELNEEKKEKYRENYDTIVRVLANPNSKDNLKRYNILKEENIELLYLIKIREVEFQPQLIECSTNICPYSELNNEKNEKDKSEKNMYFCLLKDNYFCKGCHNDIHTKEVKYGNFETNRCEEKKALNLPGECPNKDLHPNKKSFDIDYFCTECYKGICSYCKVYGNEKHPDLHIITDLFNKSRLKLKDKDYINKEYINISNTYNDIIKDLNKKINGNNGLQNTNKNLGDYLRKVVKNNFKQLFEELDEKFTDEGEKLVRICYQLNFLKDNLLFYNRAYLNKENLCINNNLRQELFWTKRTHLAHLLYLIDIKEKIKTNYQINVNYFDEIIKKYLNDIEGEINAALGDVKHTDIKKEDNDELLNLKALYENAKIPNSEFNIK